MVTTSIEGTVVPTSPSRWRKYGQRCLLMLLAVGLIVAAAYSYRTWIRSRERTLARLCRDARNGEKWQALKQLGEQWSALNQGSADALLFRADAAQHLGDFASAAELMGSIPESNPKALPTLVSLATLQFGPLNRPLEAVKTCERILQIEPRTTSAHQQLITFYAMTCQRELLERHIRMAIENLREPPQAYVYLFLADTMRIADGLESNERWLKTYPDSELFQVARLMQMPEPENGIKNSTGSDKYSLADSMLERYPNNLELLAYKLDLSIRRGNVEDVMTILKRLPAEADEDARFWRAKGWLHLNRDEIAKSREALNHAIELYPQDWNARNWLADSLRREGKFDEAESLNEIVLLSRRLRERITSAGKDSNVSKEILTDLLEFSRRCGDTQVAIALNRRLGLNIPGLN